MYLEGVGLYSHRAEMCQYGAFIFVFLLFSLLLLLLVLFVYVQHILFGRCLFCFLI